MQEAPEKLTLEQDSEEAVVESPASSKTKKKFSLPKGTKLMLGVAIVCGLAVTVPHCLRSESPDKADVRGINKPHADQTSRVSVENSPEYARKIDEYTNEKTENARNNGQTFIPPIASSRPIPHPKQDTPVQLPNKKVDPPKQETPPQRPEPRKFERTSTQQPQQRVVRPQTDSNRVHLLINYMRQTALAGPPMKAQNVQILNAPPLDMVASNSRAGNKTTSTALNGTDAQKTSAVAPFLKPGDILYAVNRVSLDSDAPGPAMVEVVEGPYRGAKVIGSFKRLNEHLVLTFEQIVTDKGITYKIKGYAIDPNTDRTAVRTDVDTHFFQRWGGIIAASFLEGFGEAVANRGASSYNNAWGGGSSMPKYNVTEEAFIAAGKVGQRMANVFENRFGMAPTVTLKSGTDMGVLIMALDKDEGSTIGTDIQNEQKNAVDNEQRIFNAPKQNTTGTYVPRRYPAQGIVY